ncbi:hypothetical protein TNCV_3505401 [Trichonephila clavipes]|uniref:YDG domain-containing protein n=1 Tax=Trichonephila clavipes TaxID=2585209 RepID=A0A8X6VE08_TRICX|nr:hypothetical protein TNCV_3505401 [Trichonephila clavipes]
MPLCQSVHDLELAIQDLWTYLPQDNIRCLINSMPDRVVACLYNVVDYYLTQGLSGFQVYKFRMERIKDQEPAPWVEDFAMKENLDNAELEISES